MVKVIVPTVNFKPVIKHCLILIILKSYTFHINLYDLAFLGAIFIGLNFAWLLWFGKTINRSANRFLALALVTMILWMVRVLVIDLKLDTYLPMQFLLALGPLMYFYVLKITRPQHKFGWKHLLHFSPLLLEQAALALEIGESAKTGAATYATHTYQVLNPVLQLLIFISNITYLYLCNKLIQGFYRGVQPVLMDRPLIEFRWLRRLLASTAVLWLLWLVFAVVNYVGYRNQPGVQAYYPFYIFFVVIIIWTAAAAFLKPQAAAVAQAAVPARLPVPVELRAKGAWLKKAMETKLYYQDPDLSLNILAEKLAIQPRDLSRVINTVFKKGFNDFINEYRVRDVATKLQDPAYDNMTLLGIAFEAGFNSKATFNRAFRQITGKAPAEFKNAAEKHVSSHDLRRWHGSAAVISSHQSTLKWEDVKLNRSIMFKNNFKIAFRTLWRNKGYTTINVIGLAVGIAACLLIFLVVQFESSFDNFHANTRRIYRVGSQFKLPDGLHYSGGANFVAGRQLRIDYPQLENVSTILSVAGDQVTVIGDDGKTTRKKFDEDGLFFIDPHFFEMFNFPYLAGDPKTALAEPNTAIVTQATAERYFGDWKKAIGRTIMYKNDRFCKITGVLKNLPANTDFPIQVALSLKTNKQESSDDWGNNNGKLNIFVTVPPGMTYGQLNNMLLAFTKKHEPADYVAKRRFFAQPFTDIHYDKRFGNYNNHIFSRELITALSLIGLFLIVIACINFVNLATAQAINRAKEVGVRKVLGSRKKQLIAQFLSEAFIITFASLIVAFVIAFIALPLLNQLLKTGITLRFNTPVLLFIAGVLVLVTFLSGLYPAIVLSGFNPITALKSRFNAKAGSGITLRRALVVLQFTAAQALVIGTLVVVGQMEYFTNASMGFDKEAVINVGMPGDSLSQSKTATIKTQLLQQPGIKSVSFSSFSIADDNHWGSDFTFTDAGKTLNLSADFKWADADVFNTLGLQIVAGKPYRPSDTVREFVVNETLVKTLGFKSPQDIIGKKLDFWGGQLSAPVVGVVKDFIGGSMAENMSPVVMAPFKVVYWNMAVKIQPVNMQQTLAFIEKTWSAAYPDIVYKAQFLDEKIAGFYTQENQLSQLYKIFAGIAIFISCLGLYGLVSFMAVQRTKEIGIRKVLGATAGSIIYLFSKEFMLLIAIAFVIAAPLAYYFMHSWLTNFSFRISIGADVFVITIAASVTIAWLTVSYKALKAAMMNPVKAIRVE